MTRYPFDPHTHGHLTSTSFFAASRRHAAGGLPPILWPSGHRGAMDPHPCRLKGFVLDVFLSFVSVCVLFRKARRLQLSEDEIRSSW